MTAIALLHPSLSPKVVKPFQRITPDLVIQYDLKNADTLSAALIFGGDGTVHRYLPELHKHKITALAVPAGSGNDFAKALGISNKRVAAQAWERFCSKGDNVKEIDLGVIRSENQETLFCCVAGVGLDAEANRIANNMPAWLRSWGGYVVAAVQALAGFKRVELTVVAEDRTIRREGYFVAVANAHRYGGGMKIAPQAKLDDGRLDICFIGWMAKVKVLCALPTLPFGGHLAIKQIEYFPSRSARIESSRPLDVYADGDYICRTPVEIGLLPRALRVIVPE